MHCFKQIDNRIRASKTFPSPVRFVDSELRERFEAMKVPGLNETDTHNGGQLTGMNS
jgi:hypothetical protein